MREKDGSAGRKASMEVDAVWKERLQEKEKMRQNGRLRGKEILQEKRLQEKERLRGVCIVVQEAMPGEHRWPDEIVRKGECKGCSDSRHLPRPMETGCVGKGISLSSRPKLNHSSFAKEE